MINHCNSGWCLSVFPGNGQYEAFINPYQLVASTMIIHQWWHTHTILIHHQKIQWNTQNPWSLMIHHQKIPVTINNPFSFVHPPASPRFQLGNFQRRLTPTPTPRPQLSPDLDGVQGSESLRSLEEDPLNEWPGCEPLVFPTLIHHHRVVNDFFVLSSSSWGLV